LLKSVTDVNRQHFQAPTDIDAGVRGRVYIKHTSAHIGTYRGAWWLAVR